MKLLAIFFLGIFLGTMWGRVVKEMQVAVCNKDKITLTQCSEKYDWTIKMED